MPPAPRCTSTFRASSTTCSKSPGVREPSRPRASPPGSRRLDWAAPRKPKPPEFPSASGAGLRLLRKARVEQSGADQEDRDGNHLALNPALDLHGALQVLPV